jgi:uncharacterized membrane protein
VNQSVFGRLARRGIAWLVLIAIAVVALKVAVSIVAGFLMTLLVLALVGVVALGAVWALRRI